MKHTFKLSIMEYGREVVSYTDNDLNRFLERSKVIINEHLQRFSYQKQGEESKNVTFQIYTFE